MIIIIKFYDMNPSQLSSSSALLELPPGGFFHPVMEVASDETAIVLVSGSHKKKTARRARASCPRIE